MQSLGSVIVDPCICLGGLYTHRLLSSSFLGLPYRILNMNHKKELLRSLWVMQRIFRPSFFWNPGSEFEDFISALGYRDTHECKACPGRLVTIDYYFCCCYSYIPFHLPLTRSPLPEDKTHVTPLLSHLLCMAGPHKSVPNIIQRSNNNFLKIFEPLH